MNPYFAVFLKHHPDVEDEVCALPDFMAWIGRQHRRFLPDYRGSFADPKYVAEFTAWLEAQPIPETVLAL